MFDKATLSLGTTKVMSNVARRAGSSQHGNARRAPVGYKLKDTLFSTLLVDASLRVLNTFSRKRQTQ